MDAEKREKLRFLFFATEWDSSHGGLSTFNRRLCTALAELGHDVTCALPSASEEMRVRAGASRVGIVTPRPVAGSGHDKSILFSPLENSGEPDIVVGHARVTGPYAAAHQQNFYPHSRRVHIFHVNPQKIEGDKDADGAVERSADRHELEVQLAEGAALLLAVGPTLQVDFSTYLNAHELDVHEILPGIAALSKQPRKPAQFTVLIHGRMEDWRLKGLDVTVRAMKLVLEGGQRAELHILGVEREHADARFQELRKEFGDRVRVSPFTSDADAVVDAIRCASVVVMPSRSEGFGLAGLEALEQGVPIVASDRSGLAETLMRHLGDDAKPFIVQAGDPNALAQKIADIYRDEESARARAVRIHAGLWPYMQWSSTAQRIVDLLGRHAASDRGPTAPSAPTHDTSAGRPHDAPIGPLPQSAHERVANLFRNASRGLATWPTTLPSGVFIERLEIHRIVSVVEQGKRLVLVLGKPGTGKSALLARLADHYVQAGTFTLSIKADQLPAKVSDDVSLGHALGFAHGARETIEAASKLGPVVVLIDQLDALADLVDYRTARLDVVLELVDRLMAGDGVSVIASSRAFEANHDLRLAELDAEHVDLGPLSEDAVFEAIDLSSGQLPRQTIDLLRYPLWLRLFNELRNVGVDVGSPATEYALLDVLWSHYVDKSKHPQRQELCDALSALIEKREEFWIPLGELNFDPSILREAIHDRLLCMTADESRVGFVHQRLYEFSRARRFRSGGIAAYAIQNQHGLACRSTLWAALNMCRQASFRTYREELQVLAASSLRLHLRVLVAEFLASLQSINEIEVRWVLALISENAVRRRFFEGIVGNEAWFRRLEKDYLPAWMSEFGPELGWVLSSAWPIDSHRVAELLREQWLPLRERWNDLGYVLSACTHWQPTAVDLVQHLARNGSGHGIERAVDALFDAMPDAGAQAFVGSVEREVREALATLPVGASGQRRAQKIEDTLEKIQHYGAEKYGLMAPKVFLDDVKRVVGSALGDDLEKLSYHGQISGGSRQSHDLFEAIERTFQALFETDQDAFREHVRSYAQIELGSFQSMLSRVLARAATSVPDLVVDFLCGDDRRLLMELEAHSLLLAVGSVLSSPQLAMIRDAVQRVAKYSPERHSDALTRRHLIQGNREYRLWLLEALNSSANDAELRAFVQSERSSFEESYEPHGIRTYTKGSPMSAAQMAKAKDADVFRFLEGLPDSTEWDHPSKREYGGSIEASREFGTFAQTHPARALDIIGRLRPDSHERPAAYGLEGVAKNGEFNDAVELAVADLEARGFHGDEFRRTVAHALNEFAATTGLSDATIGRLEQWLGELAAHAVTDTQDNEREEELKGPTVLWQWGSVKPIPGGTWPVLEALVSTLLVSPRADFRHLEQLLLAHAERADSVETWRAFLMFHARNLRAWGEERGERLIDALLANQRGAIESVDGVRALAHARWWVGAEKLERWVAAVGNSGWGKRKVAVGELIGLAGLHAAGPAWAREEIRRIFNSNQADDADLRLGVANSAANLWGEVMYRVEATDALRLALEVGNSTLDDSALGAAQHADLRPDTHTANFLRALLERRPSFTDRIDYDLVSKLAGIVAWNPSLVCAVARLVVERSDPARVRTDWFGAEVVRIALTAHRLGDREAGLALFEEALGLGIRSAEAALSSVDGRAGQAAAPLLLRPRRSRKARSLKPA